MFLKELIVKVEKKKSGPVVIHREVVRKALQALSDIAHGKRKYRIQAIQAFGLLLDTIVNDPD